jgi:hypothetical protein
MNCKRCLLRVCLCGLSVETLGLEGLVEVHEIEVPIPTVARLESQEPKPHNHNELNVELTQMGSIGEIRGISATAYPTAPWVMARVQPASAKGDAVARPTAPMVRTSVQPASAKGDGTAS